MGKEFWGNFANLFVTGLYKLSVQFLKDSPHGSRVTGNFLTFICDRTKQTLCASFIKIVLMVQELWGNFASLYVTELDKLSAHVLLE